MTIQQLRYFLALCEDLNYTHTAGRMYLSRQALRLSIAAPPAQPVPGTAHPFQ